MKAIALWAENRGFVHTMNEAFAVAARRDVVLVNSDVVVGPDWLMRLRDAASKKILIEVALLKAIEARNAVSLDAVLKQLQQLRDEPGSEVVSLPIPTPPHLPLH